MSGGTAQKQVWPRFDSRSPPGRFSRLNCSATPAPIWTQGKSLQNETSPVSSTELSKWSSKGQTQLQMGCLKTKEHQIWWKYHLSECPPLGWIHPVWGCPAVNETFDVSGKINSTKFHSKLLPSVSLVLKHHNNVSVCRTNIQAHNQTKFRVPAEKPCKLHAAKPLGMRGDSHPPLCEVTVLTTAPSCPPTSQPDHTGWRTSSDSNSTEVNRNTIWRRHSQLLTAVSALSLRWDIPCPHRKCCKVKLQRAICHDFLRLAHPTHKHTSCNRMRRRQQMWGLLWRRCSRRFVVLQTYKKKKKKNR